MSKYIRLDAGAISSKDLRKAKTALNKAISAMNEAENSLSNSWYKYDSAGASAFFTNDIIEKAGAIGRSLENFKEKLDHYSGLLDSGPEEILKADRDFKGKKSNVWQRTIIAIGGGIGGLFKHGGTNTGNNPVTVDARQGSENQEPCTEDQYNYNNYRNRVESINKNCPKGAPQDSGGWQCTWASTATVLRRRQTLEGKDPTITREQVYNTNPSMYYETYADGSPVEYTGEEGDVYHTKYEDATTMDRKTAEQGYSSREEYIANRLLKHPEGIVIYNDQHAIVITDFEYTEEGKYRFYADDPVNTRDMDPNASSSRIHIDSTYQSGQVGQGNVINSATWIWYVE